MEVANWAEKLLALPSEVDIILRNRSIYGTQCFLFKTLVISVAQYASHYFPQLLRSTAVGKELLTVLHRGVKILEQCGAADIASPGVLLTILGSLGQLSEIIDDVRMYCQMINSFIDDNTVSALAICDRVPDEEKTKHKQIWMGYTNQIACERSLINQITQRVEIDCNTLQSFLTWDCKVAVLNNLRFSNSNDVSLVSLYYKDYICHGVIPTLETDSMDLPILDLDSKLGAGSFGKVYKASWCDFPVAVKELNYHDCKDELKVFSSLVRTNSSHIVQLLGYYEKENSSYLVLELMSENLSALIEKKPLLKTLEILDIILQIAKAMKHLHDHDVVYRDLKPDNILIKKREDESLLIKLADFGVSKPNFKTGTNTAMRGTRLYMAPEMWESEEANYSKKVDVFSFGRVCSRILVSQKKLLLAPELNIKHMRDVLKQNVLNMDHIPVELKNLIAGCLEHEEDKRPTFAHICDELWGSIKKMLLFGVPVMPQSLNPDLPRNLRLYYILNPKDSLKRAPIDELDAIIISCPCLNLRDGTIEIDRPYETFIKPFTDGDGVDPQNLQFGSHPQDLGLLGQCKKLLIDQGKRFDLYLSIWLEGEGRVTSDQIKFILDFLNTYPIFSGIYICGRESLGARVEAEDLLQSVRQARPTFTIGIDYLPAVENVNPLLFDRVLIVTKSDLEPLLKNGISPSKIFVLQIQNDLPPESRLSPAKIFVRHSEDEQMASTI